jgi:hypothetical protein
MATSTLAGVQNVKVLARIHGRRKARNWRPGASSSEIRPCDCAEGISWRNIAAGWA